jgi:hypothetical protein
MPGRYVRDLISKKKIKELVLNGILRMTLRNFFIPRIQKDSSKQ